MDKQYNEQYRRFILASVKNGTLDEATAKAMLEDLASHPQADPKHLANLDEAIKQLYGPEQLVMRMRDREQPGGEV